MIFLVLVIIRIAIPQTVIQEGHNVLIPDSEGRWDSYSEIPEDVINLIDSQFLSKYPRNSWCDPKEIGCWRSYQSPTKTMGFSYEGIMGGAQYSRTSRSIKAKTLVESQCVLSLRRRKSPKRVEKHIVKNQQFAVNRTVVTHDITLEAASNLPGWGVERSEVSQQ